MNVQTVYLICILSGILLLFCSILFGEIGDFLDFSGLELPSVEIGDADIDVLPISMKSLCLAVTVFGSVSMLMLGQPMWIRHLTAGGCAYLGAFLVQNFTGFLKEHQSEADSMEDICSRHYVVNIGIPAGGYGSIASQDADHSVLTMTAKANDGREIPAGTKVEVVKLEAQVALVCPCPPDQGETL